MRPVLSLLQLCHGRGTGQDLGWLLSPCPALQKSLGSPPQQSAPVLRVLGAACVWGWRWLRGGMDYLALPFPWESPIFLISQLPPPSAPLQGFGVRLSWAGEVLRGSRVSQGKNQTAQISAPERIPIFVFLVLSPLPQQTALL